MTEGVMYHPGMYEHVTKMGRTDTSGKWQQPDSGPKFVELPLTARSDDPLTQKPPSPVQPTLQDASTETEEEQKPPVVERLPLSSRPASEASRRSGHKEMKLGHNMRATPRGSFEKSRCSSREDLIEMLNRNQQESLIPNIHSDRIRTVEEQMRIDEELESKLQKFREQKKKLDQEKERHTQEQQEKFLAEKAASLRIQEEVKQKHEEDVEKKTNLLDDCFPLAGLSINPAVPRAGDLYALPERDKTIAANSGDSKNVNDLKSTGPFSLGDDRSKSPTRQIDDATTCGEMSSSFEAPPRVNSDSENEVVEEVVEVIEGGKSDSDKSALSNDDFDF